MGDKGKVFCGLDVGTWKTCIIVARKYRDGKFKIVGSGLSLSSGLKKSIIVNRREVTSTICDAVKELDVGSDIYVDWVFAGISGQHVKSVLLRGAVPVEGKHHQVTDQNVAEVIHAAKAVPLPAQPEILHITPQEFFLDDRGGIQDPIGMTGSKLEADISAITADGSLVQTLINAVNGARIHVKKAAFTPLASGEAVLTPDEQEGGTALIDLGGGSTGIALFIGNPVPFVSVIPAGGWNFTNDLMEGLSIPFDEAERAKKEFGNVGMGNIPKGEVIELRGFGARGLRKFLRIEVCKILYWRALELCQLVREQLLHSGLHGNLHAGAVLTGGGSMLGGMLELAEEVLDMPVRQGIPRSFKAQTDKLAHPIYAGAIGLAMLNAKYRRHPGESPPEMSRTASLIKMIMQWIEK